MQRENGKRLYDGLLRASGGMDSGRAPDALDQDQVAFAGNVTFRGDYPTNRPPYADLPLLYPDATTETRFHTGRFQGAAFYNSGKPNPAIILQRGGRLFRMSFDSIGNNVNEITVRIPVVTTADFTVPPLGGSVNIPVNAVSPFTVGEVLIIDVGNYLLTAVFAHELKCTYQGAAANVICSQGAIVNVHGSQVVWEDTNPDEDYAYLFQAEKFMLVGQGQMLPIIYDGSLSRRSGDAEIPPFYCGGYIQGRIWFAFPNRNTYGAGNLFGSVSKDIEDQADDILIYRGDQAENSYLNEGGEFATPQESGPITSITATMQLDTSLGHGPVSVFCENGVFTCNAPVDRTIWKDLTYPIQTVGLLDYGALGTRSVINVNSDIWYRAIDGIRSYILARRDFNYGPGNAPSSHEIGRVIDNDTEWLLPWSSAILFDNRLIMTCSPTHTNYGVVHRGLVAINFDDISTLRHKGEACWEGLWTIPQCYQILRGRVNGVERAFAICLDATNHTVIKEILRDGQFDQMVTAAASGGITITPIRIASVVETRSMDFGSRFELKGLDGAELFIDDVQGLVDFNLKFRPDQYPCWVDWQSWEECNVVSKCDAECPDLANYKPGYRPSLIMPKPPETCLTNVCRPADSGYQFQVRLAWTGKARIRGFRLAALRKLDNLNAECL